MHLFHRWGKWIDVTFHMINDKTGAKFDRIGQQQTCNVCNYTRTRYLDGIPR